jgi:hypothetical protein
MAIAQQKPDLVIDPAYAPSPPPGKGGMGRSQFYIGVQGGAGGCAYQYSSVINGSIIKLTSVGASIPIFVELIYGTGKTRIGYQFEYQRILNSTYQQYYNVSQISDSTVLINDASIQQHFFCHNIMLQYMVYDYKNKFRLLPTIEVGYFHGISSATIAPFDYSALNKNRFKIGASLDGEYHVHQFSLLVRAAYGIVPIQSFFDKSGKGFMHLFGLHIGLRWNAIHEDTGVDANGTPVETKRKRKTNKIDGEDDR